ncbi:MULTISPECIES: YceD family protein [Gracilibacillus]|uniref:YceD family protein n=1 Tax=Gracilibacillus TaxID=74385 RepID=UPI00082546F9|nr:MULTISPECIES: YceD family protein [Gracilibacillus]
MKIFIQKLMQSQEVPYEFHEKVDVSNLIEGNNDIRAIEPVIVKGKAWMDGDDITCVYTVTGTMILPCARTLVDVPYDFHIDTAEQFTTSSYHTEENVFYVSGEVLDLTPFIEENIILEVPMRVFADKEQLEANTVTEGHGWTLFTEEEQSDTVDPRLEKLQSLLNDKSNEGDSKE